MCGRTNQKQRHACGHRLPLSPCDEYAHLLAMCLAHPGEPRKFVWNKMLRATNSDKVCRFCKEGKDIEGKWAYGRNWLGANRFLEE